MLKVCVVDPRRASPPDAAADAVFEEVPERDSDHDMR
jgi:hypothetical protein